jgi:hypothetical protein
MSVKKLLCPRCRRVVKPVFAPPSKYTGEACVKCSHCGLKQPVQIHEKEG